MALSHELLGVSPDADLATIKRAFRALAKEWHPDRSHDPEANTRFREVVSAYRSLVRERTQQRTSSWRPPPPPRPEPIWTAATQVDVDLAWDRRPPGDVVPYSARLSRLVVLGTVGFVALFWVSAFLSHL